MSHNLTLIGYGHIWQTSTMDTRLILSRAKGNGIEYDLDVLRLYSKWVHEHIAPKPLSGKDARNPYLIKERELEIKDINRSLNNMKRFILENYKNKPLFCSN